MKNELLEEKMDKMIDDLKNKIVKNNGEKEDAYRTENLQFEIENENFGELGGVEHFNNDYFLGKRDAPQTNTNLSRIAPLDQPLKKQISAQPSMSKRPFLKLDESLINMSRPKVSMLDTMKDDLGTPKPALNINLIDQTYTYKGAIDSMWEEQAVHKDQLFTTQNAVEDPMDEFQFGDDL
jgi:hypothetical protein